MWYVISGVKQCFTVNLTFLTNLKKVKTMAVLAVMAVLGDLEQKKSFLRKF